jgi:hypothetical protein
LGEWAPRPPPVAGPLPSRGGQPINCSYSSERVRDNIELRGSTPSALGPRRSSPRHARNLSRSVA